MAQQPVDMGLRVPPGDDVTGHRWSRNGLGKA